jgi:hypothetical protein
MTGNTAPVASRRALPLAVLITCATLAIPQAVSAAPHARARPPSAAAQIAALGGTMPQSFDVYPNDPCAGPWEVQLPSGEPAMTIVVMRYRNIPMAHISGPVMRWEVNEVATRLDPRSIKIKSGAGTIVLRCNAASAVAELTTPDDTQPLILSASRGEPEAPTAP